MTRLRIIAVATAVALLASAAPAHAIAPKPVAPRAGLFCPCWGAGPKDNAAWDEAAKTHSLIVAARAQLTSRYARAKQVNSNVVLIPYILGPFLAKGSASYNATLAKFPERFARDKNGQLISPPTFPNNVLMDLGNTGWQQQMADIAAQAAGGLDGVYVDSMGIGPLTGYTSAAPVDPTTGEIYTITKWQSVARDAINAVKARLADKYVMFNGLSTGAYYNSGTKILAESTADGGMSEAWTRQAKSDLSAYPTLDAFKLELAEMRDMRKRGKDFFAWTKTWATGTEQQKADWNTFAFATFLLGTQGRAFYAFVAENSGDRSAVPALNKVKVGAPKGDYTVTGGVYKREFDFVSVTVDPLNKKATITAR